MIGKPQWFIRRKYTGWGLTPKTWQGWVYILGFCVAPLLLVSALSFDEEVKLTAIGIWVGVILADVIHVMLSIKVDERERLHEAIADRNALWSIMLMLTLAMVVYAVRNPGSQVPSEVWPIIVALFGGLAVRVVSFLWLSRHD